MTAFRAHIYVYYVGTFKNKCLVTFQYGIGITLRKHPQKNVKGTGV